MLRLLVSQEFCFKQEENMTNFQNLYEQKYCITTTCLKSVAIKRFPLETFALIDLTFISNINQIRTWTLIN